MKFPSHMQKMSWDFGGVHMWSKVNLSLPKWALFIEFCNVTQICPSMPFEAYRIPSFLNILDTILFTWLDFILA